MKKLLEVILFSLLCEFGFAQTPYEKLDSLSAEISKFQKATEGISYKDEAGNMLELGFPEQNFIIWSSTRLASKAVYKKKGDREVLAMTENIDLSKAIQLEFLVFNGNVGYMKLRFPKGHLKTQIYEKGSLIKTIDEDYLEFFTINDKGNAADRKDFLYWKNYKLLMHLCNLLKIEKGITNEKAEIEVNKRFDELLSVGTQDIKKHQEFLNDFHDRKPESPLCDNNVLEWYNKAVSNYTQVKSYIDSICKILKFRPNMSPYEWEKLSSSDYWSINWKRVPTTLKIVDYHSRSKEWLVGPQRIEILETNGNGSIVKFEYIYKRFIKDDAAAQREFNTILADMKRKLPYGSCKGYTDSNGWEEIFVSDPNINYFIKMRGMLKSGSSRFDKYTYIFITIGSNPFDLGLLRKNSWYANQPLFNIKYD